jgi:hypothetical protein
VKYATSEFSADARELYEDCPTTNGNTDDARDSGGFDWETGEQKDDREVFE